MDESCWGCELDGPVGFPFPFFVFASDGSRFSVPELPEDRWRLVVVVVVHEGGDYTLPVTPCEISLSLYLRCRNSAGDRWRASSTGDMETQSPVRSEQLLLQREVQIIEKKNRVHRRLELRSEWQSFDVSQSDS